MRIVRFFYCVLLCALTQLTSASTEVSFLFCYNPDLPEEPSTRRILALAQENNELVPSKWGGLILPGAGGRATFMLALAGGTAPDIYKAWFHILRHDISEGFVYPLDEWVTPQPSTNLWDHVRTVDGRIYALPAPATACYGIIYRKDLVAAAGLNADQPPRTWSEFRTWCEKLTAPGRRAFAIENRPWGFLPWVQSASGDVIREISADDSAREKGATKIREKKYEACFDSPAAIRAAEFLQDLVRRDLVRGLPTLSVADDIGQLFVAGEIVSVFGGEDLVLRLTETFDLPPETIGMMPFPAADESCPRVLQAHRHFYAMSESVAHRPKEERDLVWKCLSTLASPELADDEVRRHVALGRARWCRPADLKRLGFTEELAKMPREIRDMYEDLDAGRIRAVTEPWVGFWQGASDLVQRRFLGLLLSDAGKTMDCTDALRAITQDANRGLMFDSDHSRIIAARPYARMILGAIGFCLCCILAIIFANRPSRKFREKKIAKISNRENSREKTRDNLESRKFSRKSFRLAPWLFLLPAALSILVWSYYPLVRGAIMAFQNYRIVGEASFVGLDNFIRVATDPNFWSAWARTFHYVIVTLLLGFLTPIFLAILLCEIPRGRIIFRFFYFLPHLTSALVVTLLWKLMFDPTENGILNQILMSLGFARQSWLQDPSQAMVCCILPGVWSSAGISSLIYIAALSSLPKDYYEAAAIDGAGIFARFRHVMLPQLAPLMVINFVGAFIAAFQGIGSIFLLTFGGPGDATQVLSLQIWKEAYNNLRFSTATTMAWFLGVSLIAFTYLQIRFLRRVEFRQAAAN